MRHGKSEGRRAAAGPAAVVQAAAVQATAGHAAVIRAHSCRSLLTALERHTPSALKSIALQILLDTTAAAFDAPGKKILHLPAPEALAAYAAYTKACMSGTQPGIERTDTNAAGSDRRRIYRCAYRLGQKIRTLSGFTAQEDLERLVFYLYSIIGIKVTGHLPGEILIPVCYFSRIYTPRECALMSLMDWGIIAGICGGGKLAFSERLTQGCGRCRACLTRTDSPL